MPEEFAMLKNASSPLVLCPVCGAEPFVPFMRGRVLGRRIRRAFGWPYVCVICCTCKEIVGYEHPKTGKVTLLSKYKDKADVCFETYD